MNNIVTYYDSTFIGKTVVFEHKIKDYIIHIEVTSIKAIDEVYGKIVYLNEFAKTNGWEIDEHTDGWGLQSDWNITLLNPITIHNDIEVLVDNLDKLAQKYISESWP